MEILHIEAFAEAARLGSISRAAQSLCISQPALTSRLQTLERELGEALFIRVINGVTLTDAGKAFLPYAQRVLLTVDEGRVALQNLRESTAGSLNIGSAPLVSTYLLPALLARFANKHPMVRVAVRTGHSDEVLNMILKGDVQIGLARRIKHPDVRSVRVYEDELVWVIHPDHPFGTRTSIKVNEINEEGLILFDRSSSYYALINQVFASAGLIPKGNLEMDSIEAAKKMVEKGLGIALLPLICIQQELVLGTVKAVPIADSPNAKYETVAIYRRSAGLGGIARAFLQITSELQSNLEPKQEQG